jgi:shikimate kinase
MTAPDAAPAAPVQGEGRAVVLIGPMGAGKTSVGRKLARMLHTTFFDTDIAVSREHGPIPEIFSRHGEERFRELERLAVVDGLARGGVVALGGGAVLDPATRADLGAHRVILLTVEPRTVAGRIHDSTRPLLQGEDAMARWTEVMTARRALYEQLADVRFDTSSGHIQHIVERIAEWVRADAAGDHRPDRPAGETA